MMCAHPGSPRLHLGKSFKCLGCRYFQIFTVGKRDTPPGGGSWQYRSVVKTHIFSDTSSRRSKEVTHASRFLIPIPCVTFMRIGDALCSAMLLAYGHDSMG